MSFEYHVKVRRICEVCPEGQKLTGISVEYDRVIGHSGLNTAAFEVEDRTVTDIYVSETADGSRKAAWGRYVIIELSREDEGAVMAAYDKPGPGGVWIRLEPKPAVRQTAAIAAADGTVLDAWERPEDCKEEIEPLVDLFTQHVFYSERTGRSLPYNLFLPQGYDPDGSYPLIMYIHDRGPLSSDVKTTLRQGVGALVWVNGEEQKKHPCIVLAPQYDKVPANDGEPDMLETTFDLYEYIMEHYAVDKKRLYTTGQSMGCMSSIAMGIRRPDFFTAFLLVAGQWDPEAMKVLSGSRMFIIVSRGDPKAFPGMNESLAGMKECGAVIQYAAWDQDGGMIPKEQVEELKSRPGNIYYAVLKTDKRDVSCHMDTWKVAYGAEGVRDWLFEQSK